MVSYKDAGVDVDKWNLTASDMKGLIKESFNKSVLTEFGSFGGMFSLKSISKMKDPVLVSTIDGVGTKMKVADMMNKWDTVGMDIVNHCSDDILCMGAKPLFFLDYVAGQSLDSQVILDIVKGISGACKELDCPLIGGETAEMPGTYEKGEYDLAGTMIGVVDRSEVIDGRGIDSGDVLIALPSSGLHTNGYSLARKVLFEIAGYSVNAHVPELDRTIGEALLEPHKSYSKIILGLKNKSKIKGISHITGGGIFDNLQRILPKGRGALVEASKVRTPRIFKIIQEKGNVSRNEMFSAFNMGIGIVLVASEKNSEALLTELKKKGEDAYLIGKVVKGNQVDLI